MARDGVQASHDLHGDPGPDTHTDTDTPMLPMTLTHVLIYAGLAVFGLLQLALARWLAGKSRDLLRRGKRVPGRLVGATSKTTGVDGKRSRHDVVEFTAEDGRRGEVQSRVGVPWSPLAGKTITVIYDPDDLEHAVIDGRLELWAAPFLFLVNGGLMTLAAIVLAVLQASGVIEPT
jgi:hypothetical protein